MSDGELLENSEARLRIWRDAPSLHGARTAALGGFSCADVDAGAALLRDASALLAAQGYQALLGPIDGDTWSAHRLVVESDGSAPFPMEPQNPAHYPATFTAAGFDIVARYVSAVLAITPPTAPARRAPGIRLRVLDHARADAELRAIHKLSLKAFAGNAFYKPISEERFRDAYRPLIGVLDQDLTILAEDADGALAGFLFGYPNFAEGSSPRTAILKTYVSDQKGLGGLLADEFHRRAHERGFTCVIHALMHESNVSTRHSEKLGGRVFRRYALWGKHL